MANIMHWFLESLSQKIFAAALVLRLQWRFLSARLFSLAFSEQTSKLVPVLAFHVNYLVQVVWNANDCDSGRSGGEKDENQTSDPHTLWSIHASAWVCAYHYDYLGNCGTRNAVVLFN